MSTFTVRSPGLRARLAVPTCTLLFLGLVQGCGPQPAAFTAEKTTATTPAGSGDATTAGSAAGNKSGGDSSSVGSPGATPAGSGGTAGTDGAASGAGSSPSGSNGTAAAGAGAGGTASAAGGATAGGAGGATAGGAGGTAGSGATGSTAGGTATTAGGAGNGSGSGNEGTVTLNLHTVETVQKDGGKIDLLWVIDNSASMAPEQDNLAANFNSFITELADAHVDFQAAITTTDVCQATMPGDLTQRVCPVNNYGGSAATHLRGSFFGDAGRKVLKNTDADLVSRFNTYVKQGTGGSNFEHGLTAVQLAVEKSLSGENEALIRPDAFLAVIVLSDEEDDGIGLNMTDGFSGHNYWTDGVTRYRYTSDDLVTYLQTAKGAGKFSVSGIVGTRNADGTLCTSNVASPREEGTQYIAAAQKTGGIIRSVCDLNWGDSMTQIGKDVAAQATQVVLPTKPDAATIVVTVNGVVNTDWTYNTANTAIKFNTGKVPAVGAAIKVTYADIQ